MMQIQQNNYEEQVKEFFDLCQRVVTLSENVPQEKENLISGEAE